MGSGMEQCRTEQGPKPDKNTKKRFAIAGRESKSPKVTNWIRELNTDFFSLEPKSEATLIHWS